MIVDPSRYYHRLDDLHVTPILIFSGVIIRKIRATSETLYADLWL